MDETGEGAPPPQKRLREWLDPDREARDLPALLHDVSFDGLAQRPVNPLTTAAIGHLNPGPTPLCYEVRGLFTDGLVLKTALDRMRAVQGLPPMDKEPYVTFMRGPVLLPGERELVGTQSIVPVLGMEFLAGAEEFSVMVPEGMLRDGTPTPWEACITPKAWRFKVREVSLQDGRPWGGTRSVVIELGAGSEPSQLRKALYSVNPLQARVLKTAHRAVCEAAMDHPLCYTTANTLEEGAPWASIVIGSSAEDDPELLCKYMEVARAFFQESARALFVDRGVLISPVSRHVTHLW